MFITYEVFKMLAKFIENELYYVRFIENELGFI